MEFDSVIKSRYSVRKYADEIVSQEILAVECHEQAKQVCIIVAKFI